MGRKKQPKPWFTMDSASQNRKGVITVEAALIMSVTIGVLVLLYSLAMIEYQNTVARAEAMRVASRVAQNWNLIGGDYSILNEDLKKTVFSADTVGDGGEEAAGEKGKTGKNAIETASFMEHDPYRFLFGPSKKKIENVQNYLNASMAKVGKLETGISAETEAEMSGKPEGNPFNRHIAVTIYNTYASPMLQFLDNIGFSVNRHYNITAKARVTEPAEFVRNVSYIMELIRKIRPDNEK